MKDILWQAFAPIYYGIRAPETWIVVGAAIIVIANIFLLATAK